MLLGALLVASCAPSDDAGPVAGPAALSAEATAGLQTFRTVGCAACHGNSGEGGIGPALVGHSEEQVFLQVRTPKGDVMPPFPTSVLSDDDVRNISAWIATLGDEMVMAHEGGDGEGEGEGPGHDEAAEAGEAPPEMSSTEIAHLRLMLTALDVGNTDEAMRHVDHLALPDSGSELQELAAQLKADLRDGNLRDAEQGALDALGPAAAEHFDIVTAHVGMALSASQRDEGRDVEYHLSQAAAAAAGHDPGDTLQTLLDDWRSGKDQHAVIDALYKALSIKHP